MPGAGVGTVCGFVVAKGLVHAVRRNIIAWTLPEGEGNRHFLSLSPGGGFCVISSPQSGEGIIDYAKVFGGRAE
jgi:hypothetical protein